MILVEVRKSNDLRTIIIKGHAKYNESGKDIVCAAVSSTSITTINAIYKFSNNYIDVNQNEGYLKIIQLISNTICNNLLDNLIDSLKEIANDYPKNITIKEE